MNVHPREVERYVVPRRLLGHGTRFLQGRGKRGLEGVVFFGGRALGGSREILLDVLVVPRQEAYRGPKGLWVNVSGESAALAIRDLSAKGSPLYVKLHSHPGEAYHSSSDDVNPLMQFDGATSVVVPEFCVRALDDLSLWATYRLRAPTWRWTQVPTTSLFALTEGGGEVIQHD